MSARQILNNLPLKDLQRLAKEFNIPRANTRKAQINNLLLVQRGSGLSASDEEVEMADLAQKSAMEILKKTKHIETIPSNFLVQILEPLEFFDIKKLIGTSKKMQKRFVEDKQLKEFYQQKHLQYLPKQRQQFSDWLENIVGNPLDKSLDYLEINSGYSRSAPNYYNSSTIKIPSSIESLDFIKKIGMYRFKLVTIPPEIANLSNLEELNFYNSRILKLHPEIGYMPKLKRLVIDERDLSKVPEEIKNNPNIKIDLGVVGHQRFQ